MRGVCSHRHSGLFTLQASDDGAASLEDTAKVTGGQIKYVSCDVTCEESVQAAFSSVEADARHPVRGLVICAGISGRCAAVDYPVDKFRKIIDINVTGTFICATAAARIMQRQMVSGSIVMLASMSGTNVNKVYLARSLPESVYFG